MAVRPTAFSRPPGAGRCRGDPAGAALPAGRRVFQARPQNAALLPAGRRHRRRRADRTALQQLRADGGARSGRAREEVASCCRPDLSARSASSRTKACSLSRAAASGATACCRNTFAFPKSSASSISLASKRWPRPVSESGSRCSSSSRSLSAAIAARSLEFGVSKSTFRLGCAPVVNLFEQVAEPILMEQKRFEYRIVPMPVAKRRWTFSPSMRSPA